MAHRARRHIDKQPVIRRAVLKHDAIRNGFEVRAYQVNVPVVYVRLPGFYHMPRAADERGKVALAQFLFNCAALSMKIDLAR